MGSTLLPNLVLIGEGWVHESQNMQIWQIAVWRSFGPHWWHYIPIWVKFGMVQSYTTPWIPALRL